jgi:hypothetical protein
VRPPRTAGPSAEEAARPAPADAIADPEPADDGPAPTVEGAATYVFGITRPGELTVGALTPLPGGGPLRVVAAADAQAVVCDVDTATFETLASPGPEGLDTLAAAAHAHDANLASLAGETVVLPLPLGTVLADDEVVVRLLETHGARLREELDRFDGYAEWAVRVHLYEDPADQEDAARAADTGSEYLRRRGVALEERHTRWRTREELATRLHERLAACAVRADVVVSRPLEDVAPPLLHGVYLLADADLALLERTVDELRAEHDAAVLEITGPWPPYHFASVDLSSTGEPSP